MLACTAIGYVAEFAVDKCRFILCREVAKNEGAEKAGDLRVLCPG